MRERGGYMYTTKELRTLTEIEALKTDKKVAIQALSSILDYLVAHEKKQDKIDFNRLVDSILDVVDLLAKQGAFFS